MYQSLREGHTKFSSDIKTYHGLACRRNHLIPFFITGTCALGRDWGRFYCKWTGKWSIEIKYIKFSGV